MVAIGIDLGTSSARVALFRGRAPELVAFADGAQSTPAVVSFAGGTARVGRTALAKATTHPADTVRGVKRLLGRRIDDPVIAQLAERSPFSITAGDHGGLLLDVGKERRSPEDVAALLLASLAEGVERACGERPEAAVLTTPYWFGPKQRAALADATRRAGLFPQQIVSEATATALSLVDGNERLVAIVDVGAGGCTASILELSPARVRLLATDGDPLGGGDDLDAKLVRSVLRGLRGKLGDFPDSPWITELLRQACEAAKRELIHTASASTVLPFLPIGAGLNNQRISIERETTEALLRDTLARISRASSNALAGALVSKGRLAAVHVTGGLTRMTSVRGAIERALGPISSRKMDPDGSVALGAAHQAAMLDGLADAIAVIDVQSATSIAPPPMSGRATVPPARIHTPPPTQLSKRDPSPPPPAAARASSVPPEPRVSPVPPKRSSAPPRPSRPEPAPGALDATELRAELAPLLAALRAGAVTDATTPQAGSKLVARSNDIDAEALTDPGEQARTAERLAGLWTLLALVLQAARQYRWEHTQTERQLDRAFEELQAALALGPRSVVMDVGTTQLTHEGRPVWHPDRPPLDRIPYELFVDGVRRIQLKEGISRDELRVFLGVLTRDAALGFGPDDDAATVLFSRGLPHVGWLVVDAFADGDDPEFEEARDEVARELVQLASAEGAALLGIYAEARRRTSAATSHLALDAATRAKLEAAVALPADACRARFAAAFAVLDEEAELTGESDAVRSMLDAWAEEQVKAHAPGPALALFLALDESLTSGAQLALRERVGAALFPASRVRAALEASVGELPDHHVEALRRLLSRGADETVVAAAIRSYPAAPDELRELLVDLVLVPAAGEAAELGPLLAVARPRDATRLLQALRAAGGAHADGAFAFAFRSPSLEVRLEALALLADPPPDHARDEIRRLIEDRERDVRLRVLRAIIDRRIGAAREAVARRVRDRAYHDQDEVERALLLEALAVGDRRRAEAAALELLELQGLFRGEAVEQSRTIAADFLASSESLEVLEALQRLTKRWFTSTTLRDSANRAADNVARKRNTPRPEKA